MTRNKPKMTMMANNAQRASIKAAMQRASMFLVTGKAKAETQRAFHRHLIGHHLWAAVEQALLAGDLDLAHLLHDLFIHVHYGEGAPAAPPAAAIPGKPKPALSKSRRKPAKR